MLRTAVERLFHNVGTTSREGAFTELDPCPFHDGCPGMRRPELPSMDTLSTTRLMKIIFI